MNFRIRKPDADEAEFEKCEKAYRQHLKRFEKDTRTYLWKYFGWDFFHDGSIESLGICGDLKTVVMRLSCPNIKRLKANGDHEYVNVMFECTFHTVSTFTVQYEIPEHSWDVRKNATQFLDAEINTSPILNSFGPEDERNPDPHYSLLIRLEADYSIIWLELVFSEVDVAADEPAAFALMESDPRFEVPTWFADKAG
jgi:hypothetical protein